MTALACVLLSAMCLSVAKAECLGDAPSAVLDCLQQVYAERDVKAYEALLAPGFTFVTTNKDVKWSGKDEVKSAKRMFAAAETLALKIVSRGTSEPTETGWRLSGVHIQLTVGGKNAEGKYREYTITHANQLIDVGLGPAGDYVIERIENRPPPAPEDESSQ